jgi:hypothetical protein
MIGVSSPGRVWGIFFLTPKSRPVLGPTQPPNEWVSGFLSLEVKRPGREADHSPHLVPKSIMSGYIPPFPQYSSMAWCSVKKRQRDKFTFTSWNVEYLSYHRRRMDGYVQVSILLFNRSDNRMHNTITKISCDSIQNLTFSHSEGFYQ